MESGPYRFDRFTLDLANRNLMRDGTPVDISNRYFDALVLLVREQGKLVPKERFFDEVWRGVPVTDEALTQGIKTLRRQLGDDAARPRFIETVPKHGYRFIAELHREAGEVAVGRSGAAPWQDMLLLGAAGTVGGGLSGFIGGLIYGFAWASQPLQPGMGAVSVLLVLWCLCILVALIGGAGVAFGMSAALSSQGNPWFGVLGGAAGGLIVGAMGKLLGLDAFNLLLGESPGNITGASEGLVLGAAVGVGYWAALARDWSPRRKIAIGGLAGGVGGAAIALAGGKLMAGSLNELARNMPGSRLQFGHIGSLFGEQGFGPISNVVTAVLEGGLFSACVVGAMLLARRHLAEARGQTSPLVSASTNP